MRPFSDKPYRFFPPKYRPHIAWFLRALNRRHVLPRRKLVVGVDTVGSETIEEARSRGDRLLFLPNHATHADGPILTEALRQVGVNSSIMAAYDVFLRSRRTAWIMQTLGGFSVDRECCDRRSLRQADKVLSQGRLHLTMFPEGQVFLQNDLVTPFSEGALFIGATVARRLAKDEQRVVAIPVSMKATLVADVRERLADRLRTIAQGVGARLAPSMTPREALREIGTVALGRHLRERGIPLPSGGSLPTRIRRAAESVLHVLYERLGKTQDRQADVIDRIRHVRRIAHEVLLDPEREEDHAAARVWADEAFLAWRIASYSGDYVAERPNLDRIAETLERLEEDAFSRFVVPWAPRRALVRFGTPVDLTEVVAERGKLRELIRAVTGRVERSVQAGLDDINADNDEAGAEIWNDALGDGAVGRAAD